MTRIARPDFVVEIAGRGGLLYEEGSRTLWIDGEMLTGDVDYVVYSSSSRWHDTGEAMTESERSRVIDNIRRALESEGMRIDVE